METQENVKVTFIIFGNHQHHDFFTYQSRRADAAAYCSGHSRSPAAALDLCRAECTQVHLRSLLTPVNL